LFYLKTWPFLSLIVIRTMAGGAKIRNEVDEIEVVFCKSDDESAAASRASTAKRKKKRPSKASTTASATSSVKTKDRKKKALKKADNLISDMTGMADPSSESKGKKKKKVPKKIKRTKSFADGNNDETDDGISLLTDTSKSTKGTPDKKKKKKKRSSSKKPRIEPVDENHDPDSPSSVSVASRGSKSSVRSKSSVSVRSKGSVSVRSKGSVKRRINYIPASRSKNDDDVSCLSESSKSKRNRKTVKTKDSEKNRRNDIKRDLSKLNKRDLLYHTNSKKSVASATSPYYPRRQIGLDNSIRRRSRSSSHSRTPISNDSMRRSRSSSHSRTSTASAKSNTRKKSNTFGRDGNSRLKRESSNRASMLKRSESVDRYNVQDDSDSDSVSISDSTDEEQQVSLRMRENLCRTNSLDDVRQMALVSGGKRVPKISNPNDSNHTSASSASRRRPPPSRSASADHVQEMQRYLVKNSHHDPGKDSNKSNRLYVAPSASAAPLRRVLGRNSSAPLRSAMRRTPSQARRRPVERQNQQRGGSLRSDRSALSQQTRTNSRELSTAEHVKMLKGMLEGTDKTINGRTKRSSSQPASRHGNPGGIRREIRPIRQTSNASTASRSLSPHQPLRNSSHRADRSDSKKGSDNGDIKYNYISKGDLETSDLDDDDLDEHVLDIDDNSSEHEALNDSKHATKPDRRDLSRSKSKRLRRSPSESSFLGISSHSFKSTRSLMSIDRNDDFVDVPKWKAALQYLRLLPPEKGEMQLQKKARICTWLSLSMDFIASMVAMIQYDGATLCCGEPIFNVIMRINWNALFRVVTVMYMCMILAEIVPVVRNGVPMNIVNPTVGILITFGMFFDDSIGEAVAMWVIEALAIFFEFLVYRCNATMYNNTNKDLEDVDQELESLNKRRKKMANDLMNGSSIHGSVLGSGSMHGSRHGSEGSWHGGSRDGSRNGMRKGSRPGSRHPTHSSRDGSRTNKIRDLEMGGRHSPPAPRSGPHRSYEDDDDSMSGHSFGGDDDFYDELTPSGHTLQTNSMTNSTHSPPPQRPTYSRQKSRNLNLPDHFGRFDNPKRTTNRDALGSSSHSYGASTTVTGVTGVTGTKFRLPGEVKKNKLLRRRRILRERKTAEEKDLHYHFVGTILNIGLASLAMIIIVTIASTGGLCFKDDRVSVFTFNQIGEFGRCNQCFNRREECEVCEETQTQCYFPYA